MAVVIGVLGLQGCVEPHLKHIAHVGAKPLIVRDSEELSSIDALIIPGGESSTMLRILERTALWEPLVTFGKSQPVWGVCAGAILAAQEVVNPQQPSCKWIALRAHRNFYGSQQESFSDFIECDLGSKHRLTVDFIRAPKLEALSPEVSTLAFYKETPVLFRQGRILASAFHSELGQDSALHDYFKNLV